MRFFVRKFLAAVFLASLLFLPAPIRAQDKTEEKPKDPERAFMEALTSQAYKDIHDFNQAKGKKDMAKHPGHKWADIFWQYRTAHPGTEIANVASSEAVWMLLSARDFDALSAKLATLNPDDPSWPALLVPLSRLAWDPEVGNRPLFFQIVEKLVKQTQRETTKAAAYYQLAVAYQRKDPEKAKTFLRAAIEAAKAAPSARYWEESEGFLYELTNLNVGQAFPHFAAPTTDKKTFSPEDLRGKTVLLNFWATW